MRTATSSVRTRVTWIYCCQGSPTALAFDAADEIIGRGFTFLDFLPPQANAAASVPINVGAEPARVELYAALSALSQIGE